MMHGRVMLGAGRYQREYFERTMGRATVVNGPVEKVIEAMVDRGAWMSAPLTTASLASNDWRNRVVDSADL